MAMVLARSVIPTRYELRSEPVARHSGRKSESARLTMREEGIQEHKPIAITLRRETMIYMTVSAATLLFPLASDAKLSKIEMKKKVMEKLRKLRQGARQPEPNKEKSSTSNVDGAETPNILADYLIEASQFK